MTNGPEQLATVPESSIHPVELPAGWRIDGKPASPEPRGPDPTPAEQIEMARSGMFTEISQY